MPSEYPSWDIYRSKRPSKPNLRSKKKRSFLWLYFHFQAGKARLKSFKLPEVSVQCPVPLILLFYNFFTNLIFIYFLFCLILFFRSILNSQIRKNLKCPVKLSSLLVSNTKKIYEISTEYEAQVQHPTWIRN